MMVPLFLCLFLSLSNALPNNVGSSQKILNPRVEHLKNFVYLSNHIAHPVDSPNIYWSKWNWDINEHSSMSMYGGAYFKTVFTGSSFGFTVDQTGARDDLDYLKLGISVDGGSFHPVYFPRDLDHNNRFILPKSFGPGPHYVLCMILSVDSLRIRRWYNPGFFVRFTSILTSSSGSLSYPSGEIKKHKMLFYGDSAGEGMEVNGDSGSILDNDDFSESYTFWVGKATNSELSSASMDGQGYSMGNLDNPPFISDDGKETWDYLWDGVSRLNSKGEYQGGQPDYVVLGLGLIDDSPYEIDKQSVLHRISLAIKAIRTAAPNAHLFLLIPFARTAQEQIYSAYNKYTKDHPNDSKNVHIIDLGPDAAVGLSGPVFHPLADRAKELGLQIGREILAIYDP